MAATNAVAKIEAQVIVDDPAASCSTAQIRAVHLSADAPAVDVAPHGSAADAALVKGLVYPKNTGYMAVKAGAYDLDVRLARIEVPAAVAVDASVPSTAPGPLKRARNREISRLT